MLYITTHATPIGKITLASNSFDLIGLWIEGQKYFLKTIDKELVDNPNLKIFNWAKSWLDRYFKGEKPNINELPLKLTGSEFQCEVLEVLCKIPYGKTTTYGDIAKEIAQKRGIKKMSAQAIGGAISHNPISIIIPCHRVMGKSGHLVGYAGGIDLKTKLLEHEKYNLIMKGKTHAR